MLCEMNFKYVMSTIKSSFLPAIIFAAGLCCFYAQNPYETFSVNFLHYAFLAISGFALCGLYTLNLSKPFFSLLCATICYFLISELKKANVDEYIFSPQYLWICFLLPFNLLLFYFIPQTRLKTKRNFYLFLGVLLQAALVENFGGFISQIPQINVMVESMPLYALIIWASAFIFLSLDISFKNTITNTGLFYADSCLMFGLIYSANTSGFVGFFFCFALIALITAILDLYKKYRYDILDNVSSYPTYLAHAANKFPFKYTIGVFCVDNRDKILAELGYKYVKNLEQMLIDKITDMPYEISIYRFNSTHCIMVFKNETAKRVMEYCENIRHDIAASEFIFPHNQTVKITISTCVCEKTRKDLNAAEVINRAYIKLKQHTKFNLNILIKA